jgi:hypothetical protein
MKKLVLSLIIATLPFMVGCTKNSGSTSVDEFLDSYEKIVVKYEEMASNGALTSGDLGVMMKAVNDMNMANLEISNKAEALKDQEWNDAQKMRQINLGSRFSQAMMNMSNQTSNGNGSITSSPDKSITKKDLQELKMSKTKNVDLCRDSVGMLMFKGLIATQQIQQFKDQHIGETFETSLLVGDISKSHDHYTITSPVLDSGKNIIVKLYALTDDDVTKISKISLGSLIKLKGVYKDLTDTYIEIGPAILIDELQEEVNAAQKALAQEQEIAKELETLPKIQSSDIKPISGEMYELFLDSESVYQDRDTLLKTIRDNGLYGKVIEWSLTISEILETKSGFYIITKDDLKVKTIINIRNSSIKKGVTVESLKAGDNITVKGYVGDVVVDKSGQFGDSDERYLYLDPAIILGVNNKDSLRKQLIPKIENLKIAKASNISRDSEIYECKNRFNSTTEKKVSDLYYMAGEIVDWSLPINTIKIYSDYCKIVTTSPSSENSDYKQSGYVRATIYMYPKPEQTMKDFEKEIEKLGKGKYVRFKGVIEGFTNSGCQINPAIFLSSGRNEELIKDIIDIINEPLSDVKIDDPQLKKLFDDRFIFDADERKKIASQYIGKVIEFDTNFLHFGHSVEGVGWQNVIATGDSIKGNGNGFAVNAVTYFINNQQYTEWDTDSDRSFRERIIRGKVKSIDKNGLWLEPSIFVDGHYRSYKQKAKNNVYPQKKSDNEQNSSENSNENKANPKIAKSYVDGNKSEPTDLYEIIDSESNLREGPGTNYRIIRKSIKGEVGENQLVKMGWIKLKFTDGSIGWVHEQNLKPKN